MAKYDGLIIPRSYNDYINKSDPVGVQQALALTGVMDDVPTVNSAKPAKSGGVYTSLATKTDKVSSATVDNLASLDANGNLVDSGKTKNIIPSNASASNKLVTESTLNAVSRVYEYNSSNVPTKAEFLNLLVSSIAHIDFKFANTTTDYLPTSNGYWYVQKFGGTDSKHVRLLAIDWTSGNLYIGDANSTDNTIAWWKHSGTQV